MRRRGSRPTWLAWGLVAVLAACGAAPPAPSRAATPAATQAGLAAALQARLDELHAASRCPGVTAAVVLPDGTLIALASGLSDRGTGRAMQPTDRMLAGSVGKTFVAALALQLVHEGRLGLDDPVGAHLGAEAWFARLPNAPELSVRRLLNHTSGLVRYEFDPDFLAALAADPLRTWSPQEELAFLLDTPAPFAAGAGWEYSDSNYVLLGLVLERAGGAPLDEQIAARLLRPFELADTSPSDGLELAGLVQGYAGPDNGFVAGDELLDPRGRLRLNPQFEGAGGGYLSTSADLARWAVLLFDDAGPAIPAALRDEQLAGVPAPMLGPGVRYGLGVILREGPLGPVRGHSGFFPGWQTEMRYYPALRCAVALQCNTSAQGAAPPLGAWAQALAKVVAETD